MYINYYERCEKPMMEKFDSIYADSINDDIEFDVVFNGEEDGSLIESVDPEYFYNESGEEKTDVEDDDTEKEDIEEKCKKEAVENISTVSDLDSFLREMEEEGGDDDDTDL